MTDQLDDLLRMIDAWRAAKRAAVSEDYVGRPTDADYERRVADYLRRAADYALAIRRRMKELTR